jgi:hypothetical protein
VPPIRVGTCAAAATSAGAASDVGVDEAVGGRRGGGVRGPGTAGAKRDENLNWVYGVRQVMFLSFFTNHTARII